VSRIERVAQRVHGLVDDLLEVSRTDRPATLDVSPRPVAIDAVFSEAEAMLAPLAAARDVTLRFEYGDQIVLADAGRVLQVLSNLVGNALKFTPAGGSVDVCAERAGDNLRVRVRDTGAGIDSDALPHIFDPYWQGNPADRTGVGLGLVIARAIVEAHGGEMAVESAPGAGTTFTFSLPLARPESA
jgi:signal transduction histidine kinase